MEDKITKRNRELLRENGFTVEQSISGYWRLFKDGELLFDDSACEDVNEDQSTAIDLFAEYVKECEL